jgi:hypothetical protein
MPLVKSVSRKHILELVANALKGVEYWRTFGTVYGLERAVCYANQADVLMNVLESLDCGSHGGFDRGQPRPRHGIKGFYDRYNWLKGKK